jgi:tetratricopeptide (TPR) repeat protein
MSVSFVDKAGSQEMSVSLNLGAANNLASEISKGKGKETERTSRVKSIEEVEVTKLLEISQGKNLAVEVLKPFFSKLAQVGIILGPQAKTEGQSEKELEKIALGLDSFEDTVEIKNNPDFIQQIKKFGQQAGEGGGRSFSGTSQEEVLSLLKEYAAVFTEYTSSQTPDLAEKLKDLRQKLIEKGVSDSKLQSLEASIKEGRKVDVTEVVKEALVLQMLSSESKIERTVYGRGIADLLQNLDSGEAKQVLEKAKHQAKQELQSFALEELENTLIKKTYLQDHDYREAVKLVNLAEKTGVDSMNWLENVWAQKKDDHGLYLLDVPQSATGVTVDTSTDNPSNNRSGKHGYEYEQKDESEILVNRLRALYMQRALKGDAFTHLKTEFKIRKLKNGLFRLGIFTKDLDEQVRHEAEIVAKVKIIEMLKEALVERATFYDLAGPAHELVERKIKGLLKNAERLGMPISAEEFTALRDQTNHRVFGLSKTELEDVRTRRSIKDSRKLEKKEKLLIRLLTRIKEESGIEDSIPEVC